MSDPQQPEQPAGEGHSGHDQAQSPSGEEAQSHGEAADAVTSSATATGVEQPVSADAQQTETRPGSADTEQTAARPAVAEPTEADKAGAQPLGADDTQADAFLAAQRKGRKQGLLVGIAGGALVGLIVVLALGAFVWPGFLAGPGKPDGQASAATTALASKNADALEKVSCHGPDGKSTAQIPAQAMQMIQSVKPTGPTQQLLDTEAVAPVDITLSAQGQTQNVSAEVVLGVTKGQWCLKGISQRQ